MRTVVRWFALGLAVTGPWACSETKDDRRAPDRVRRALSAPPEKAHTRFMRIRTLLEQPPQSRRRATELYGLVRPLCTESDAQREFLATAKWSVGHGDVDFYLPIRLALDVLEHVAGVCGRTSVEGTLRLLEGAREFLGREGRLHVLIARTLASAGRLSEARKAAQTAVGLGNAHAIALAANIEARIGRESSVGYSKGMLDAAIETASAEPNADWHAIDLAAVLATRARLLAERGLWIDDAGSSREGAIDVFRRIVAGPFPHRVRSRAADALCFESADLGRSGDDCRRAGEVFGHIGAAVRAGVEVPASEASRSAGLALWAAQVPRLKPGTLVLVVLRGDEQELLEWARPAGRILKTLGSRGVDLLILDRSRGERASALIRRVLELADVRPWRQIDARQGTATVPCVAAVLADRRTPKSCPLGQDVVESLAERSAPAFALLIGRDLDAEIDDLRLYQHPVVLMSFRRSEMEDKGLEAWMKSLSDVLVAAEAPSP